MTLKNTILAILLVAILVIIAGLNLGIIKAQVLGAKQVDLNTVANTYVTLPDHLVGLDSLEARATLLDRVGDVRVSRHALDLDALQPQDVSASLLNV